MGPMMHRHLHLPEEIIEDIVVRLPVKSIIRFKSVSKSWFILITSTSFIYNKHLITSEESYLARIFVLGNDDRPGSSECVFRSMNICDIRLPAVDTGPVLNFELPSTPHPHHLERLEFVDHCNGIVCLKFYNFIFLVNPSLKQVKNLPIPPVCDAREYCNFVGFGFDNITMDFKVVRMLSLESGVGINGQRFEIYSLRSNAWRKLDEFPLVLVDYIHECRCRRTVFLNGVIHWCVRTVSFGWRVLIFNMATELFQQIEFPQGWDKRVYDIFEDGKIVPDLFVLNQDSLAFASYLDFCLRRTYVDIWTMNKENMEETWTKLYSIGPLSLFTKPLTFSKKHRFLYEAVTGMIILYDVLNHHRCVSSQLPYAAHGLEYIIELGECRASLVSINM